MSGKDYYQVLGVRREAAGQEIKEAYRKLAFQYHPDRNKGEAAAVERMKEINEAYAVLSDPEKRSRYDMLREEYGTGAHDRFRQAYSEQDIFRGSDINQIFEDMARTFGFRGFEEVFGKFSRQYRTAEFRGPGVFGRVIVFGPGRRGPNEPGQQEIPQKRGIMERALTTLGRYALKAILGKVASQARDVYGTLYLDDHEAALGGKAVYFDARRSRRLSITIPPGTRKGQVLRLKGMGEGPGAPGDLYLKVEIRRPLMEKVKALLKL